MTTTPSAFSCAVCLEPFFRGERMAAMHCRTCRELMRMHHRCHDTALKHPHCLKCKPRPVQRPLPLWGRR